MTILTTFFGFLSKITLDPERKIDFRVSFWPFWALKKVGFFLILEDFRHFFRKTRIRGGILAVFFPEIFDFWSILDNFDRFWTFFGPAGGFSGISRISRISPGNPLTYIETRGPGFGRFPEIPGARTQFWSILAGFWPLFRKIFEKTLHFRKRTEEFRHFFTNLTLSPLS